MDVEECVKALKARVHIMYALPLTICEVYDLGMNKIGVAGGVWAWGSHRVFLCLGEDCKVFWI